MSGDAYVWAKAHPCPSARAKAVLKALAGYADADGRAWAPVSVLLIETDLGSERTVQRGLEELRTAAIIEDTGEKKNHLGKLLPIYRLALEKGPANTRERLLQERRAAEAHAAPEADLGVTLVTPQDARGDTGVTPRGDTGDELGVSPVSPKYIQRNLQSNSQGAREGLAALLREVEGACDVLVLRVSDPSAALAALASLEAQGVDLSDFPDRARRWCASDTFKRLKVPRLQDWLTMGQWRGYPAPAEAPPAQAKIPDVADAIPADVRAGLGEDFARAWLVGARWVEETRVIVTKTKTAADRIRNERRAQLAALDVRVLSPAEVQSEEVA